MECAVAITHLQASAERRAWVIEQRRLMADLDVVVYPDRWGRGRLANYRMAWRRAWTTRATHLLVLSDDMIPCQNFSTLLTGAIEARPDAIISLFSMRQHVLQAKDEGLSWLVGPDCAWGGTMLMPVEDWRDLIRWEPENVIEDDRHQSDDVRLALWARERERDIYVTAPSLVQHEGASGSTIGYGNSRRVSPWFADGSPVDWNTDAVRMPATSRADTSWLRA